jgi:6,7-dimethyl-8-ribityllumazine synthase
VSRTPQHASGGGNGPPPGVEELHGEPDGAGLSIGIVVSRFNQAVTSRLLAGAVDGLVSHGVAPASITVLWVPGAWELTQGVRHLLHHRRVDAVVALGCVIRGETAHFDYIAGEAARSLASTAAESNVPITFGVLTTDTVAQAMDRAGGAKGNKGYDAALSALELRDAFHRLDA